MIAVDPDRIAAFVGFFSSGIALQPFDFCSASEGHLFPPRGREGVLDYFFFCCAHQFGFWHLAHGRYDRPMTATLEGLTYKGSDYLWRCTTRQWTKDPAFFDPARMPGCSDMEWDGLFRDDHGTNPLPMWRAHLDIIQAYAGWFASSGLTPADLLRQAHPQERPLAAFLDAAGRVPGYAGDPLRKKLFLLAVVLEHRPEHFLEVGDPDSYGPIIDYHLQQSALRTGLVTVTDPALRSKLVERRLVSAAEEQSIRAATYEAIQQLVEHSGVSVAAIDYFFFTNRTRCPEMREPDCPRCPVRAICARQTGLFQPVFRTTAY